LAETQKERDDMTKRRDKYVDSTTDNFLLHFGHGAKPELVPFETFAAVLVWLRDEERYHWPMKAFRELCRQLRNRGDSERYLLWAVYQLLDRIEEDGVFIENTRSFFSSCDSRFKQRVPGSAVGQIQEAYPGSILE
jgi:hypothetical protein